MDIPAFAIIFIGALMVAVMLFGAITLSK